MNRDIFDEIDADLNHFEQLYPELCRNRDQYYDNERFNTIFGVNDSSVNDFSVIHVNIRSLNANGNDLNVYLSLLNLKFDVVCLSETWVKEGECVDNFFPNHYCFYSSRCDRRGGGVAIFVNKKFECSVIPDLAINEVAIECVCVTVASEHKVMSVGVCYRPPNSNFTLFQTFLDEKVSLLRSTGENVILCGDFNLDLLKINEDAASSSFFNGMNAFSLLPVITKPTRITDSSCTLIDNIFSSYLSNFTSGILTADISDHLPIFIVYRNFFANNVQLPQKISFRIINETSLINLCHGLNRENLTELVNENDIDKSIKLLNEKILHHYNLHCPIKTKFISPKDIEKPWINIQLKNDMKKRQAYFRLFKRNLISTREYNSFRNFVTFSIRAAKKEYYKKLFADLKSDTKKTWNLINNILQSNRKRKVCDLKTVVFNNQTYSSDSEIAEAFNEHFSSVGNNIDASIPSDNLSSNPSFLNSSMSNSFFFKPTTNFQVNKIIMSFKNKSSNINTFSTKILKCISSIISPTLTRLINISISSGHFPTSSK